VTTVAEALDQAAGQLRRAGIADAAAEARYLLGHFLDLDTAGLLLRWHEQLTASTLDRFYAGVCKRCEGTPFSYVVGYREFFGRSFTVDERVLIPRPETETLVELALELLASGESSQLILRHGFVDLCTGSGAVGVTLACEMPQLTGWLVDIDPAALMVARQNARKLGVAGRLEFVEGDLFSALGGLPGGVGAGLVTANPPYVSSTEYLRLSNEVRAEPEKALVGGPGGLEVIERIVAEAPRYVVTGGWLCLEIGADQYREVERMFVRTGAYEPVTARRDLAGNMRVIGAALRRRVAVQ